MIDWILGAIAECAYWIARFHDWRAGRFERRGWKLAHRARRANEAAERWSKRQKWADRVEGPFGFEGPRL